MSVWVCGGWGIGRVRVEIRWVRKGEVEVEVVEWVGEVGDVDSNFIICIWEYCFGIIVYIW